MQAVLGRSCRVGQEMGQKGKGRSEAFRSFNGLVQPRMELTRRAFTPQPWSHRHRAPVNAILGRLGHSELRYDSFALINQIILASGCTTKLHLDIPSQQSAVRSISLEPDA